MRGVPESCVGKAKNPSIYIIGESVILIFSDAFDKHADLVCLKLDKLGAGYFRFNLDVDSLKNSYVLFEGNFWKIRQYNKTIKSNEITKAWARRTFVEMTLEETGINDAGFKIWKGEWNKTLIGIYCSLRKITWLNKISNVYQAENKYLQMEVAKCVGLNMPDLIVSNDKSELIKFASNGEVVLKLMNQDFYEVGKGDYQGIYVNKINASDLSEFSESNENPIVVQKYVDKKYEVRYTYLNGKHLACRIESQMSEVSKIDWRRYDIANTPHYKLAPPCDIVEKVNDLMRQLDLEYGALDFIVAKNGEWYFLEINTMGQWLWIEDLTELPISDEIVCFLTS